MSRFARRAVMAGALLLATGCGWTGEDDGAVPVAPCRQAAAERRPIEGFGEIAIRLTSAAGKATEACVLLADDEAARSQGLMGQADLRGYDGMLFRYDEPGRTRFLMRDTLIPLTVAFYAADGRFVSAVDMTPCPAETVECPRYEAGGPYLHALEVPVGGLERLGGGPGSTLSFPPAEG